MESAATARQQTAERMKELGEWLIEHADALTAEMDEMLLLRGGLTVNADIDLNGIQSVRVVKNYLIINR